MNRFVMCAVVVWAWAGTGGVALAAVPWATSVVQYSYDGDGNPANDDPVYSHPEAALGEPSRMGGAGTPYAAVVSIFSGPWTGQEVVTVAPGGQLVLGFDRPITHSASHPYGVDLIVFGNAFFSDEAYPGGQIGSPAMIWDKPGIISLSADGIDWRVVPGVSANSLFPTQGYLDSGPYDKAVGHVPSDFLMPVNPALTLADFDGLSYSQALALYNGSGGGAPVDISKAGLEQAHYVKITVPQGASYTVAVDAVAVVPEPASLALLAMAAAGVIVPRRARQ